MADIYEIQDALEKTKEAVREVKAALEHAQHWLDSAAAGYSRGGFDAKRSQIRIMKDRRDRLTIVLAQHEARLADRQARFDKAYAEEADEWLDEWLVS